MRIAWAILIALAPAAWARGQVADNVAMPPASDNVTLSPIVPADNAVETPFILGGPSRVRADVALRELRGGLTVLYLTGRVSLDRGASRMEADRAVVWIDNARSAEIKSVVMDVYAEGNVVTSEEGLRTKLQATYFRWGSAELTVDDLDGFVDTVKAPPSSGAWARAEEARHLGRVPPTAGGLAAKAELPRGVIEPKRVGLIYGQQQEGPDIRSHVEGDWRVTAITRYPDIVIRNPRNPNGDMEILAENMVIWVNEAKMRGAKPGEAEIQVYAEGNVVIYQAQKTIECEQMFYDMKTERGLLIGGPLGKTSIRSYDPVRKTPFYYRAKEFRQVAEDQYQAKEAIATTCEFPDPGWGVKTKKMTITVGKEIIEDARGDAVERATERVEAVDTTLVLDGIPVFYWPSFSRDITSEKTVLKNFQFGHSSRLGTFLTTQWDLYRLGFGDNDWSDAVLDADLYSKRGIGLGLEYTYHVPGAFGDLFVYEIKDHGTDVTGLKPPDAQRERLRFKNRWQINDRWRMDAEVNYLSDRDFLNEFWEKEFKEEKEPESYLYFRYLKDDRTFTALVRPRLNNFQTQNEYLPEFRYAMIGEPLGPFTWISDQRVAYIERKFDRDAQKAGLLPKDYSSGRLVTEQELQLPMRLGCLQVAPFVNLAYALYSDLPASSPAGNSQTAISAGVRASATWWKTYDVYSRLLDVNRVRHIVTPYVDVYGTVATTSPATDFFQFDAYDAAQEGTVLNLGLRQRWQTRRIAHSLEPARSKGWVDADWMILDVNMPYYSNPSAALLTNPSAVFNDPNEHWGPLDAKYQWQITDRISIVSELTARLDRSPSIQTVDFGFNFDRSPRTRFYVGQSYVKGTGAATQQQLLLFYPYFVGRSFNIGEPGGDYTTVTVTHKFDERWTVDGLVQYDWNLGQISTYRASLQHTYHCWVMEVGAAYDPGRNDRAISIYFWPVGMPHARMKFF